MSSDDALNRLNTNYMIKKKLNLNECKEAFDMHDEDKRGIITTTRARYALKALGHNPNEMILEKMKAIAIESEDGEGKLSFENFLDLVCQQIRYSFTDEDMIEDFKTIDKDEDGKISKFELRSYLENLKIPFSSDEIDEIVHDADHNKDGCIDYSEFIIMMRPDE